MPLKCAGNILRLTAAVMLLSVTSLSLYVDFPRDASSLEVNDDCFDFDDLELIPQVYQFDGSFFRGIRMSHDFLSPADEVFIASIFRPPVM